jgi:phosphoglycolate phosphatase-like HAD superfamily hydrolase
MEKYVPDTLKTNELETWIADLHSIKTKNFLALLNRGLIPLRPGIARLIQELRSAKIEIAIVTTTTPENVTTLLKSTLGKDSLSWFNVIAAGGIVPKKSQRQIFIYGRLNIWAYKHNNV